MAALAAELVLRTRQRGLEVHLVDATETIFAGALVGIGSTSTAPNFNEGELGPWEDGDDKQSFIGLAIVTDYDVDSGFFQIDGSDTPQPFAPVDTSGLVIEEVIIDAVSQVNVQDLIFCNTDNIDDAVVVATTGGNPVGRLVRMRDAATEEVDIKLFTPEEHIQHRNSAAGD